ncbi:tumor necrosis factor receptor superfamily member 1B-like [Arapaima gigas]
MFTSRRKIQLLCLVLRLVSEVCMLPYRPDSNQTCKNPSKEYFNQDLTLCCSKCQPGYRLKFKCSTTTDSVCEPCRNGTYSDKMSSANCFKCLSCRPDSGLEYAENCTSISNSRCVCKEGWSCTLEEHGSCKACSRLICPSGYGLSKKGEKISHLKCEPCKEGTFSDKLSSTQTCQKHTNCTSRGMKTLFHGNATADTKCIPSPTSNPSVSPDPPVTTRTSVTVIHTRYTTSATPPQRFESKHYSHVIKSICCLVLLNFVSTSLSLFLCLSRCYQKFLPEERDTRDPSTSSTSSQAESNNGVWTGPVGTSKPDTLPPESQHVNFSVITTINYSLCSSKQLCSPVAATAVPSTVVTSNSEFPLSQEEMPVSHQCEEGKEFHMAVQESGKDIC